MRKDLLMGLALAVILPVAGVGLVRAVGIFDRLPAAPFFVAVIAATLVGRLSAGVLASCLSSVLIVWFELPVGDESLDLGDLIGVAVFMTSSFLIAYSLSSTDAARDAADLAGAEIETLARALAAERNTMRQVLRQMPNGVVVSDREGNIIVRNVRSLDILEPGLDTDGPDDVRQDSWIARRSDGSRYRARELPLDRSLRTGEVVLGERIEIERHDGTVVTIEVDSAPIRSTDDETIEGAVCVFQDVTERIETQKRLARSTRRLQQLQAVTDATLSGRGFDDLAQRLLGTLRAVLETDSATLLLLDRSGTELVEHSTVGVETDGPAVTVPLGLGIAGKIAGTATPLVADDLSTFEPKRHWLTDVMSSLMGAPLVFQGEVRGVIHVATRDPRRFSVDELEVLELAANRIASALERASLADGRAAMAQALQRSLLPESLPEIHGVELAALYRPFSPDDEIGGDFYDVFPHGDGSWAVVVGDVSGKGPDAAAVMGLAAHTLRASGRYESRPSAVLRALNDALIGAEWVSAERFCTVCQMRLRPEPDHLRITLCLAGHPLPYLVRADGSSEHVGKTGTIIGSFVEPNLHDVSLDLGPGDALIAFTDGLIEHRDVGVETGERRLREYLLGCRGRPAEEIVGGIEHRLLDESLPDDDVALVVVRKP
jgi:sigma-B regulation protein RsbU (phosphoserine phosphatase)